MFAALGCQPGIDFGIAVMVVGVIVAAQTAHLKEMICPDLILLPFEGTVGHQDQGVAANMLVRTSGRARAEVARSLGISDNTLRNWVLADRDARTRAEDPDGLSETERAELARLRRENADLRVDREILRKAAAFFARETTR